MHHRPGISRAAESSGFRNRYPAHLAHPCPLTHVACSCLRHQEIIFRFTKSTRLSSFHYIRADARTAASLGRFSSRSISAIRQNGALSFSDRQEIVSGRGDLECGHRWREIQCTYRHTQRIGPPVQKLRERLQTRRLPSMCLPLEDTISVT